MRALVTPIEGEPFEVRTKALDTVTTERKFHGIKKESAVEASFFMTWNCLHREGGTALSFDEWLGTVEDVEDADEKAKSEGGEGDPDPLESGSGD